MTVTKCDICKSERSVTAMFITIRGEYDNKHVDAEASIDLCDDCKRARYFTAHLHHLLRGYLAKKVPLLDRHEEQLCHDIEQFLMLRRIPYIRTHGIRGGRIYRPYRAGTPDFILCLPWSGRMVQIEVKTDEGIVSEQQEDVMREFHQAKALVFVARSVEEVSEQINAAGGKK